MKREDLFIYASVVLSLFLLLSGCAVWKNNHKIYSEECFGVWVNSSYNNNEKRAAKIIYNPDMTWTAYKTDSSFYPGWRGTISVIKKWRDRQGNVWYKITTNQIGLDIIVYELWKINKSATIIEGAWGIEYVPQEINPASGSYTIYYRYGSSEHHGNSGT